MKTLLTLLLLIPLLGSTQTKLDSLRSVWNDLTQADTNRLKAMSQISRAGYLFTQPDSAFYFAQQQYDLANKINEKKYMANALSTQGVSLTIQGDYKKAMKHYNKSLDIYKKCGNKKGLSGCYNNIAIIHNHQGNYSEAIEYYKKSLKIDQELNHKSGVAMSFNNIGIIYHHQGDYKIAIEYYSKSLKIDQEIDNKPGIALSLNVIGNVHFEQGDYSKALGNFTKSIAIYQEIANNQGVAQCLNDIGNIHTQQGNYIRGIDYYTKSLRAYEDIGEKRGIALARHNIANIYLIQKEYDQALNKFNENLEVVQELADKKAISQCLNNIGSVYLKKRNFVKAKYFFTKSLRIDEELSNKKGMSVSLHNLGNIFFEERKYIQAKAYFSKSLKIDEEVENKLGVANSLNSIGEVYYCLAEYDKAKDHSLPALMMAQQIGALRAIRDCAVTLSRIWKKSANYKESLAMYELYITMRDSINSKESQKEVIRQEFKCNYEKKEALANAKHAATIQKNQLEALAKQKEQNIIITAIAFGLVLVLIFTFFVINRLQLTRKQKSIIEKQKTEVEEQKEVIEEANAQKDIMFSILGHDLRGPISQLNMGLNLLYNEGLSQNERKEILQFIKRDADNTYRLIDNLFNWAISQKGEMLYQPQLQSIDTIIEQNMKLFEKEAQRKNIHLQANLSKNSSAFFDQYMINTVIRNLMSNAIKFTNTAGTVKITSQIVPQSKVVESNWLQIDISDNGVGIPSDRLARLFTNHKTISTFGTDNEKGVGLGLQLCKNLIEKNGGTITAESVQGKGTTFILCLPLAANH